MADGRIDSVVNVKATESELDKLFNQLQKVFQLIKQISDEGGKINLSRGISDSTVSLQAAKAATEQLRLEREKLKQQEAALSVALAQSRLEQQNYNTAAAGARNQIAQLNLARRQGVQQVQAEAGSLVDLRNKLNLARKAYDNLGAAARDSTRGKALLAVVNDLNSQVTQLENSTGRFQRNVGNYPTQVVGGLKDILGQFTAVAGGAALAKEIFDTTVQINSLNSALLVASKSQEEFSKNQTFLKALANSAGVEINRLEKAYTGFYAASTQAGLSANSAREIFTNVTRATANLKLSQDDTNGVLLAFSQILGKGTVQSEELRGQIGERLPGAFAVAAKSIGVTEKQLNKMLQNGEIVASEFLPKFAAQLNETFGNGQKPIEGLQNSVARLRNAFAEPIEGLQNSIARLKNAFTELVSDNESNLSRFFGMVIDLAKDTLVSVNNLLGGVSYLSLKLTDTVAAGKFLNSRTVDDLSEKFKGMSIDSLLDQTTAVNKNLELTKNTIQIVRDDIAGINKAYGDQAQAVYGDVLKRDEERLKDLEIQLDRQQKLKNALNAEVDSRLKNGDDLNARPAAPKEATQAEKAAAARLAELRIKANADAQKVLLQQQIDDEKEILENDNNSYSERLNANAKYIDLKKQLLQIDVDAQKARIQQEIALGKAVPQQLTAIEAKAAYDRSVLNKEESDNFFKITKDNADDRVKALMNSYEQDSANFERQQIEEQARTDKYYKDGKINTEQYELEKLRIKNKYDILTVQSELDAQKEILAIMQQQGLPVEDQQKKILDLQNKLRSIDLAYYQDVEKEKTKASEAESKKRQDIVKQEIELTKQLSKEGLAAIFSIFDANYTNQKNQVQEQIDDLDKQTQKEIDAVNASTASEQEKADKIAIINAKAQAQKNALANKQKQIDEQKAKFDRLKSIGDIVAQTAVNIVKVFPNPVLIALAAAVGAAQLAQVLATPIPKYFKGAGVKGQPAHKGGLAQVNDGGKLEPIVTPSGQVMFAEGANALVNLKPNTKVYPSIEEFTKLTGRAVLPVKNYNATAGSGFTVDTLSKMYTAQTSKLVQAIEAGKTQIHVSNTATGLRTTFKKANDMHVFLQREIFN